MDRLHEELAALPGLEQLSASQLRDLPWRVKENVFIALFRQQVSSGAVADELQSKSRDRKLERKADKLLDDVDRTVVRKKEESYRADFMQVAAAELARLGAPALISWQKLVFDNECCAQAFRLLLTRIKSSRRSMATSGVSNSSSLLAARYANGGSRHGRRVRRESDKNAQSDEEDRENHDDVVDGDEPEGRTRFPPLKPSRGPLHRSSAARKNGASLVSRSTSESKNFGLDWNFDTTIETPHEEDEVNGFGMHGSAEKFAQIARTTNHQTGADISIERTLPNKLPSYFASRFKKNQLQVLQEENSALTSENAKLREEIKQLEELNAVLQSDNSSNSLLDDCPEALEFAQRRMRLVQAQNLQLQRQVSLLQDALLAHENAEANLMSALNHWRSVVDAGREEAKAAGADQNAAKVSTEPEETGALRPIKWMLAIPDKLMDELKRVEGQIQGAANALNACFETKLRVSKLSASFLRTGDSSLKLSEVYGRESTSLAHLRVERVKQLEDALGQVSAELDQLSAKVLKHFPPKASTTDSIRSTAYELGRSVQKLLVELGAFGVVVPNTTVSATSTDDDASITAIDVIKALSSTSGVAKGPGGAKERETQAKVMLKQLNARYSAVESDLVVCRREAEYWRKAWSTQDDILRRLAKRVRQLGQKKVDWCKHYLLAPMVNLSEVFASFQQAYDENTTRQNPYLPLLVETLSMEHPMLVDALKQWQDYSNSAQAKMDELVADYEANRLVLASSSAKPRRQPLSSYDDETLPSVSEQIPVR